MMKWKFFLVCILAVTVTASQAQYKFKPLHEAGCTSVKNQQRTGTCWSFATCSFMESELMRQGKGQHDLSEMFVVKNIYKDKARNYLYRQGKANFSQGSLAHDFIKTVARHGIVPETVYDGRETPDQIYNHGEMEAVLKAMLDAYIQQGKISEKWDEAYYAVLDLYLGTYPESFSINGEMYSPKTYAKSLGVNPDDYINITSFTHHPFYEKFILEVPDNYSNGSYFNLPIDELQVIVTNALKSGYTVAWDGDVSEKGFSAKHGLAILPVDQSREDVFTEPGEEIKVDQEMRQEMFERFATTDDHLMHLVGIHKDQAGNKYFKVKNSWGEVGAFDGFMYMSYPYFNLKTIAITVHKDAVPKEIAEKLNL